MRAFQQLVVFLFALFAFALAQEDDVAYDATIYITSTVYRVNTVTMPGTPSSSLVNSTSTIAPSYSTGGSYPSYPVANGTTVVPTGGAPSSAPSDFPGAASQLNVNAFVAAVAAGVAYLSL